MVTLFPSSPSLVGTCGQAYWLSWVYFLMFTVRIWIKSNCLHCVVFGKKVWKKGKQGHCPKLCRQWFLPCPDCDLLILLEQSSTDSRFDWFTFQREHYSDQRSWRQTVCAQAAANVRVCEPVLRSTWIHRQRCCRPLSGAGVRPGRTAAPGTPPGSCAPGGTQ